MINQNKLYQLCPLFMDEVLSRKTQESVLNLFSQHAWTGFFKQEKSLINKLFFYQLIGKPDFIPQSIRKALDKQLEEQVKKNLLIRVELSRIALCFNKKKLVFILLKGFVAEKKLDSKIILRPFSDLDLLVREKDVDKAVSLLSKLGFAAQERDYKNNVEIILTRQLNLFKRVSNVLVKIDLHWNLTETYSLADMSVNELFKTKQRIKLNNEYYNALSNEYMLAFMCYHFGLNHFFSYPLKNLFEIHQFIIRNRINWNHFLEICKQSRISSLVYYLFYMFVPYVSSKIPERVEKALRNNNPPYQLTVFKMLAKKNGVPRIRKKLVQFFIMPGWKKRKLFIRHVLFLFRKRIFKDK